MRFARYVIGKTITFNSMTPRIEVELMKRTSYKHGKIFVYMVLVLNVLRIVFGPPKQMKVLKGLNVTDTAVVKLGV